VNKKVSILPVCDKPYHTNKRIVQKGEEIGVLRKYALSNQLKEILQFFHPPELAIFFKHEPHLLPLRLGDLLPLGVTETFISP